MRMKKFMADVLMRVSQDRGVVLKTGCVMIELDVNWVEILNWVILKL